METRNARHVLLITLQEEITVLDVERQGLNLTLLHNLIKEKEIGTVKVAMN